MVPDRFSIALKAVAKSTEMSRAQSSTVLLFHYIEFTVVFNIFFSCLAYHESVDDVKTLIIDECKTFPIQQKGKSKFSP